MSEMIWSVYVQLSYNAYGDVASAGGLPDDLVRDLVPSPRLRWDPALWDDLIGWILDAGANQLVLSLGDGICYESHPEIALEGAWTSGDLRREIVRLNELGHEVVPELNFSTTHDLWLNPYHRMISTPDYCRVCADLIAEVIDLFDRQRFFHLGFDEETLEQQRGYEYVVLRQHDLSLPSGRVPQPLPQLDATNSRKWR